MSSITDQSFSLQVKIFHTFGLYPSKTHPTLQKVKSYILFFVVLLLVEILLFINIIHKEYSDNTQKNLMFTLWVAIAMCGVKIVPFFKNLDRVAKCINYFGHPWFVPKHDEEERIVTECVQVCRRISLIYLILVVTVLFLWNLPYLLVEDHVLPIDVWLPYDVEGRHVVYYTTFACLSAVSAYSALAGAMLDSLFGGLAYHVISQLKILVYNLQHLNRHENHTFRNQNCYNKVTLESVSNHLQRCVALHNHILNFVTEFEDCFSLSMFSQLAVGIIGVCFTSIALIFTPARSVDTIKILICFSFQTVQMFIYCYFGTLIYEENERFINAVCMAPWYDYDVKIRKVLIIMMERSKRPMIITAEKLIGLSLATFTSLAKTSYSLVAVMKKFQ